MPTVFEKLGLPKDPLILAPLAGLTDLPFRRVCWREGADLTYIEMLSAIALMHGNKKTMKMLNRHEDERVLGVQVSGKTAEDMGKGVEIVEKLDYETIDLNMGCPVKKVVQNGGGSAFMKDPDKVFRAVKYAREATDKPLSVKIRVGWDVNTVTAFEVAHAIEEGGADWMTVHGRLRSESYDKPVNLMMISEIKKRTSLPVIGNGNVFSRRDAEYMREQTGVDGIMISRGCLGNPWVFNEIKSGEGESELSLDYWLSTVLDHLKWQGEMYGEDGIGPVCMRKHLLWYVKGFPGARRLREKIVQVHEIKLAQQVIIDYANELKEQGITHRDAPFQHAIESRYTEKEITPPL